MTVYRATNPEISARPAAVVAALRPLRAADPASQPATASAIACPSPADISDILERFPPPAGAGGSGRWPEEVSP